MKLTASLLQGTVRKQAASKYASQLLRSATPGGLIYTAGGPIYRVVGKVASPSGVRLRIARKGGEQWITGSQLAALKPMSPAIRRFAALVHRIVAFDSSLSSYVDAAIDKAGLPKDPTMNWGRWFKAKYAPVLSKFTKDESLIDDAIREVIMHQLYDLRLLDQDSPNAHFDPDRVGPGQPMEKKVAMFLSHLFSLLVPEAIDYVKMSLGVGAKGELGRAPAQGLYRNDEEGSDEGDSYEDGTLLSDVDKAHDSEDQRLGDDELNEFLAAFKEWYQPRVRENTLKALNLITDMVEQGHNRIEIKDALVESDLRGRDGQQFTPDTFKFLMNSWIKLAKAFLVSDDNPHADTALGQVLVDALNKPSAQKVTSGLITAAPATQEVGQGQPPFVPWHEKMRPEDREPYVPVERDVTQQPDFREWFDGSKVVDVDGKPMVCFHGTSAETKSFTQRNKGYGQFGHWFDAWPESIEHYMQGDKPQHRPNTIAVYLAIRKPKEFHDIDEFKGAADGRFGPTLAARCQRFRMELKKAGYDGAVIRNSVSTPEQPDFWVAFDGGPKQVRSAFSETDAPAKAAAAKAALDDTGKLPNLPYSNNTPSVTVVDQKPQNPNVQQQTQSLSGKNQTPPSHQGQDTPPQITQMQQGEDDTQQPQQNQQPQQTQPQQPLQPQMPQQPLPPQPPKKPTIPPEIPGVNHV